MTTPSPPSEDPVRGGWSALLRRAVDRGPVPVAVAHAVDRPSLEAVVEAGRRGLVRALLVGPPATVAARLAEAGGAGESAAEIVPAVDEADAAARAVALCREGRARVLLKGRLHTHVLLRAVLDRDRGLRTARLLAGRESARDWPAVD